MLRENSTVVLLLLALITIFLSSCTILAQAEDLGAAVELEVYNPPRLGRVSASSAIIRTTTDVTSLELARLSSGTIVKVIAHQQNWQQIETLELSPNTGWVLMDFLALLLPMEAVIKVSDLNIRTGPSIAYERIGGATHLAIVNIIGQALDCTWLKVVTSKGIEGWVSAQYILMNVDCNFIPVVEIPPLPLPTPAQLRSAAHIKLLEPVELVIQGRRIFRWESDIVLEPNQGFEMILWEVGQDPMVNGFGPNGITHENSTAVDLEKAAEALYTLLKGDRDYKWGVLLVEVNPYRRLQYLGSEHQFRFQRIKESSQSNQSIQQTPVPTLLPPPTPVTGDPPLIGPAVGGGPSLPLTPTPPVNQ